MSDSADDRGLDLLAAAARAAAPPPTPNLDQMVVHAALVARNRSRRSAVVAQSLAFAAVLSLAVGGPLVWLRAVGNDARDARSLRFELPAGDAVAVTPDADFSIDEASALTRTVTLRAGAMLFDVAPLEQRASFTVSTSHLRAEVRGTVFEVRVSAEGSQVHVYEGRVTAQVAGRAHTVTAGQTFDSVTGMIDKWSSPLASIGRAAASRRARPAAPARAATNERRSDDARAGEAHEPRHDTHAMERDADGTESLAPTQGPTPLVARAVPSAPTRASETPSALLNAPSPEATDPSDGERWMQRADQLRVAGAAHEAVLAYERAAELLGPSRRTHAGYAAASLLVDRLAAPERASSALDRTLADRPGSPVESHALVLRARALADMGRDEEARLVARRYLARFPDGAARARMEQLASDTATR